ncbi:MAG: hypothetical protein QHH06_04845 [Clostridiales bacterium]|jgi:DNA-directed RNA polymerase subunit M/transcription elongation factor TFIIS|nr:hypothetical protein [Eubacteriales bacterium]MDH7565795.1 hypothetical protein [Clostridiales bacterium]
MKCAVCNYRYKEPDETSKDQKLVSDGEKEFIKVINSFHRKAEDGHLDEVYLFACPKCGTVRLEKW